MQRVEWICPGCHTKYGVPSTVGLVLCPKCTKTNVSPSALKRRRVSPAVITAFVILLLTPVSGALLYFSMTTIKPAEIAKAVLEQNASKSAVRKWLKENLDDGSWEEVKWWPVVKSHTLYEANARKIISQIEESKKVFESGSDQPLQSLAEWKQHYEMFEKNGIREFSGLKYRTRSPLGGKVLREQIFEITNGDAKPLEDNKIVEFPAFPNQRNPVKYDGWLFMNNPEYDPDPVIHPENISKRLQVATLWKEPRKPKTVRQEEPRELREPEIPLWQRKRQQPRPIQILIPERDQPEDVVLEDPPDKPGEIPRKVREYFDRADEIKQYLVGNLEREIEQLQIEYRGSIGEIKIQTKLRITASEKSLEKLKKTTAAAPISLDAEIGDVAIFESLTVISIIDENTLLAKVICNRRAAIAIIHPIVTKPIKVGQYGLFGDFFKIKANQQRPSELMNDDKITYSAQRTMPGGRIIFVVEPVKKLDMDNYRKQYEQEKKAKQK